MLPRHRTVFMDGTVLVVPRHTVDAHPKHVFVELDTATRVELTVLALRRAPPG